MKGPFHLHYFIILFSAIFILSFFQFFNLNGLVIIMQLTRNYPAIVL